MAIGRAANDLGSACQTPRVGGCGEEWTQHRACRQKVGQLRAVETAPGNQPRVVVDACKIAIVGEQVRKDRGVGGGRAVPSAESSDNPSAPET